MFVRKLVASNLQFRKVRVALTVAAVALSVSLVVAVTSGYESVKAAVTQFMNQYLGSVDAQVSRQNDPRGAVTERAVQALRDDPDVKRVDGRVEIETPVLNAQGEALSGRNVQVFGIDPTGKKGGDPRLSLLTVTNGQFLTGAEGDVAVVDQALAERLLEEPKKDKPPGPPTLFPSDTDADKRAAGAGGDQDKPKVDLNKVLGTNVTLPNPAGEKLTVKVVGVIRKPEVIAQYIQTMYLPLRTLQRYQGWDAKNPNGPQVNRVEIELSNGVDPRDWEKKWQPKLAAIDQNLKLKLTRDARAELDKQMASIDMLSYLGGTVSMLAATFIVFSSLSMGVSERQRTLAMMRAVGAYRSQIAWLVIVEGMLLATAGVAVGVPAGILWVKLLTLRFPELFTAGVAVSWGGVLFGSVGSILAALAAAALPAWWATRVDPLEAMTPQAKPGSGGAPVWAAVAGTLLLAVDPFLLFGPIERIAGLLGASDPQVAGSWARFVLHFLLGLPAIMFGFFLLAPLFVKATEKLFGPIVAWVLGLNPALLRQQLSSGIWRAAGTAAALMVGLAVLTVMQIQGHSALEGWKLPTQFPDLFIVSPPGSSSLLSAFGTGPKTGVDLGELERLETIPGIRKGEIMPIAIAAPQFGHGAFAVMKMALNPEATMFFGIDPNKAFDMMELEFRDGSEAEAKRLMLEGKALHLVKDQTVIPASALAARNDGTKVCTAKGVNVDNDGTLIMQGFVTEEGDSYRVEWPRVGTRVVPKSQVEKVDRGRFVVITNEFRELRGWGVGDDFPLKKNDGTLGHYTIAGVVWSPGIDVIVSVFDMGRQFDQRTAASVFGSLADAKEDFGVERIYLFAANLEWDVQKESVLKEIKDRLKVEGFRAGDVRGIKERIVIAFRRLLNLASTVAFAAMAVASLGVTNTVMAGIRTRRWQFGVLRSIGVTRGQLLRLVLSESLLLGVVACLLGLAAGGLMAIDAKKLQVLNTGYNPPLAVPWPVLGIGVGIVMLISLLASLWPAVSVARTEPLTLLQAGRAAA